MSDKAINLLDKFKLFDELRSPKVIGDINDYQLKVAWFENEFVGHDHTDRKVSGTNRSPQSNQKYC